MRKRSTSSEASIVHVLVVYCALRPQWTTSCTCPKHAQSPLSDHMRPSRRGQCAVRDDEQQRVRLVEAITYANPEPEAGTEDGACNRDSSIHILAPHFFGKGRLVVQTTTFELLRRTDWEPRIPYQHVGYIDYDARAYPGGI